ncbi:hypothetical protein LCGC14_0826240 [marine sediment metagenome]|uniref:Uncharacterized protein n=1 Tax=marine sediment metagenome TaxID=412755 RepID=A0A0F9S217_9ZZZZ
MQEGAEGPTPESSLGYTRRIRAMVHEAASHYSPRRTGQEMMDTALDLYAVALDGLFGERWRKHAHPEHRDILRHYIDDPVHWETAMAGTG